jgi:hypothetical protein
VAIVYKLYRNIVILMCTQSLSCLKSKYILFFSARRVSRHAGRDVRWCYLLQLLQAVWRLKISPMPLIGTHKFAWYVLNHVLCNNCTVHNLYLRHATLPSISSRLQPSTFCYASVVSSWNAAKLFISICAWGATIPVPSLRSIMSPIRPLSTWRLHDQCFSLFLQ